MWWPRFISYFWINVSCNRNFNTANPAVKAPRTRTAGNGNRNRMESGWTPLYSWNEYQSSPLPWITTNCASLKTSVVVNVSFGFKITTFKAWPDVLEWSCLFSTSINLNIKLKRHGMFFIAQPTLTNKFWKFAITCNCSNVGPRWLTIQQMFARALTPWKLL